MSHDPRVTVVTATRDRRERVLATLPRLLELPERPPVVVVDDASSDGTADAVTQAHPDVTVVRAERNLGAAARNLGVERARTPYVAFADDDSWYAPGALRRAADVLDAHPNVGLVAARVTIQPDGRPDPTNHAMATSPLRSDGMPGPEVLGFIACGAIARREAFLAVGGFDARLLIGGEEELLALDLRTAGWRAVYVADVEAHHQPDPGDPRPGRRRRQMRNRLWVAWLRRSPSSLTRITARSVAESLSDRADRAGVADALRGLPAVWRARHPVPRHVERAKRRIERAGA